MTDLDRLATLAKAATPGPWYIEAQRRGEGARSFGVVTVNAHESGYPGAEMYGVRSAADAAYIAALDPTTVLDLIAMAREAERLRSYVGRVVAHHRVRNHEYSEWCDGCNPALAQPTGEATE
jgi:hypothetical protein